MTIAATDRDLHWLLSAFPPLFLYTLIPLCTPLICYSAVSLFRLAIQDKCVSIGPCISAQTSALCPTEFRTLPATVELLQIFKPDFAPPNSHELLLPSSTRSRAQFCFIYSFCQALSESFSGFSPSTNGKTATS